MWYRNSVASEQKRPIERVCVCVYVLCARTRAHFIASSLLVDVRLGTIYEWKIAILNYVT